MAWMFIPQIDPEAIWNRIWSGIWTLKCEKWQKKRGNCHGTSHRNWDWRSGKFDDHQKGAGVNNYHFIYIYIIQKSSQESIHQSTSQNIISIIDGEVKHWCWTIFVILTLNQSTFYGHVEDDCEIHHQKDGFSLPKSWDVYHQLVRRISRCHPPYVTLW